MDLTDKKKFKILENAYKNQELNDLFLLRKKKKKYNKEKIASGVALALLVSNLLYYFYKKYKKNIDNKTDNTYDEPFEPAEPAEPAEPGEPGEPGEPMDPSDPRVTNNFFKSLSKDNEKARLMEFLKDLEKTNN